MFRISSRTLLFEILKGELGGNDMNPIQSKTAKCNKGRFQLNHKEKALRKRNRIDLEITTSLRPRFGI
jgi:hypothetical protein